MSTVDHVPLFFVTMVYGIGSLAFGDERSEASEGYYSMALDHIGPIYGQPRVYIQAILACAVSSIRSRIGASLWMISGVALRQCVELAIKGAVADAATMPKSVQRDGQALLLDCV